MLFKHLQLQMIGGILKIKENLAKNNEIVEKTDAGFAFKSIII